MRCVPSGVEKEKCYDTEQYDRRHRNRKKLDMTATRLGRGVNLRLVKYDERCLVEVAALVGVRIDEEALGAAFHVCFRNS